MTNFNEAYQLTSVLEGGYVNDPFDRGGETYKGISRKYHSSWKGWQIIDTNKPISRGQILDNQELDILVLDFYKKNFWNKLRCDSINQQDIANELYDTAVNMGTKSAIKILQKAINLLSTKDVHVDGFIGPITIHYANKVNQKCLLKTLNGLQFTKYVEICEANPSQKRVFKGWLKRI